MKYLNEILNIYINYVLNHKLINEIKNKIIVFITFQKSNFYEVSKIQCFELYSKILNFESNFK